MSATSMSPLSIFFHFVLSPGDHGGFDWSKWLPVLVNALSPLLTLLVSLSAIAVSVGTVLYQNRTAERRQRKEFRESRIRQMREFNEARVRQEKEFSEARAARSTEHANEQQTRELESARKLKAEAYIPLQVALEEAIIYFQQLPLLVADGQAKASVELRDLAKAIAKAKVVSSDVVSKFLDELDVCLGMLLNEHAFMRYRLSAVSAVKRSALKSREKLEAQFDNLEEKWHTLRCDPNADEKVLNHYGKLQLEIHNKIQAGSPKIEELATEEATYLNEMRSSINATLAKNGDLLIDSLAAVRQELGFPTDTDAMKERMKKVSAAMAQGQTQTEEAFSKVMERLSLLKKEIDSGEYTK